MPEIGQMLYRACPICDRADAERFWEKGTLLIQRCRGCSMLYANPVPEEIASGAFYQQRGHYLLPEKLQSDYAPVRYERELKLFKAFCKGGAVLDVGCSTGAFLYQLETRYPRVYEVIGTDVPGAALDFAKTRGIAVTGEPFLNWDLSKPRFDAVTFWAVMEHLIEPKKFIQKAVQALKPGGHCFVLVPNAQSLAVRLLGMRYRYITAEHLNYFTSATLRTLLARQEGFAIAYSGSTHFNPVVIWQDLFSRGRIVPDLERAQLLKRTTAWKQSVFLAPLKPIYRAVERMLGAMKLADNLVVVLRRK